MKFIVSSNTKNSTIQTIQNFQTLKQISFFSLLVIWEGRIEHILDFVDLCAC